MDDQRKAVSQLRSKVRRLEGRVKSLEVVLRAVEPRLNRLLVAHHELRKEVDVDSEAILELARARVKHRIRIEAASKRIKDLERKFKG